MALRQQRLKLDHKIIPGLREQLENFLLCREIKRILPGRIEVSAHSSGELQVKPRDTITGFKLICRKGFLIQQVFVVCERHNKPSVRDFLKGAGVGFTPKRKSGLAAQQLSRRVKIKQSTRTRSRFPKSTSDSCHPNALISDCLRAIVGENLRGLAVRRISMKRARVTLYRVTRRVRKITSTFEAQLNARTFEFQMERLEGKGALHPYERLWQLQQVVEIKPGNLRAAVEIHHTHRDMPKGATIRELLNAR